MATATMKRTSASVADKLTEVVERALANHDADLDQQIEAAERELAAAQTKLSPIQAEFRAVRDKCLAEIKKSEVVHDAARTERDHAAGRLESLRRRRRLARWTPAVESAAAALYREVAAAIRATESRADATLTRGSGPTALTRKLVARKQQLVELIRRVPITAESDDPTATIAECRRQYDEMADN